VPRPSPAPARKRHYHHGDLRRALVREAVRTIGRDGIDALTLREAGRRLGVSRTALYRHFANKSALLAAVAREGFQRFRQDLLDAWEGAGTGMAGFRSMGVAYVRFAVRNESHFRVMFGRFRDLCEDDPELDHDASAAFQVLIDALIALQQTGEIVEGDPQQLAHYVWAVVHGIATLAIDGQLGPDPRAPEALIAFGIERMREGIEAR
jgi:AcrR family transcriptional regulator